MTASSVNDGGSGGTWSCGAREQLVIQLSWSAAMHFTKLQMKRKNSVACSVLAVWYMAPVVAYREVSWVFVCLNGTMVILWLEISAFNSSIVYLYFLQALIDRPDEIRRTINFKRLVITDYKVDIPRLAKKAVLKKALEDADVFGKFAASNWGKKIAKREAKASLNDFERHVAAVKKMKRSAKVRSAFNKLKKSAQIDLNIMFMM